MTKGTTLPRYYVVNSGGKHWVMDSRPHPEGASPIGLIWYRHAEEADRRAAELNAEDAASALRFEEVG